MSWEASDLADQGGRTVVVTGGNSGIGFEAARTLAARGARVIVACRNAEKAAAAVDSLSREGTVEAVRLDLASLASVRSCADDLLERCPRIDVLINNAGIMAIPRRETEDGFEMQIGTNHFGHFALTALLFERIAATPDSRVVTVSSLAHHFGFVNFANLHGALFYDPWAAYAQSKLANLLFAFELDRRLRAAESSVRSVACHPGISATNLGLAGPRMAGLPVPEAMIEMLTSAVAQPAAAGALPTLYAGFGADVRGGDYFGPDGFGETRGAPRKVQPSFLARSAGLAARLWAVSETATGLSFAV